MKPLRIATRHSPLALWQAQHVATLLMQQGVETVLVPLVSGGDADMRPIDNTRQVGLFTKRIQQALLDDEADIAVHSLKDLPTQIDSRLLVAAIPPRETVVDCLVSHAAWTFEQLPSGARIGTGSRRRAAQLLHARSDLQIDSIRGNVQTRLSKLDPTSPDHFDAILLADAGLLRLEMDDLPRYRFSLDEMLPAPGQGALAVEIRCDDIATLTVAALLNHIASFAAVTAERRLLSSLHGGCLAPIAAYAKVTDEKLQMTAVALSPDGSKRIDQKDEVAFATEISLANAEQAADALASMISHKMSERGALEIIRS